MKPRQRLDQAQTSRMYLRRKDHRDCIMNDIYHNAIWMSKEQDGERRDELVWLKYPKHYLLGAVGINNLGTITMMDVDRQLQYGYRQGNNMAQTILLDNGIAVYLSQTGSYRYRAYATIDGIVWKDLKIDDSVFGSGYPYHFGRNGLVIATSTNPLSFRVLFLDVVEGEITTRIRNYGTGASFYGFSYMCNTQSGMIIYGYDRVRTDPNTPIWNNYMYHLSEDGTWEKRYEEMNNRRLINANGMGVLSLHYAYCNCGNKSLCVTNNIQKDNWNRSDFVNNLLACETDDDGFTWTFHEFEVRRTTIDYRMRVDCCVRDGEFFVFYGWSLLSYNVKCFASYTGTAWNEIELPSWVDLPVVKEGACVNPNAKDVLRVAIRPSETSGQDIRLYDLLSGGLPETPLNRRNGNILFKDGKACSDIEEDIYFCFGGTGGWKVYFDNKYLASSSKAFAWNQTTLTASGGVPDTVQPNDYVIRP